MNKPSKNVIKMIPHHLRDISYTLLTLARSLRPRYRAPDAKMHSDVQWHEDNQAVGPSSYLGETLTILSWNVFKGYYRPHLVPIMQRLVDEHNPDILTLQEAPMYPDGSFLPWPKQFGASSLAYVSSHKKIASEYCDFAHTGEMTVGRMPFVETSFHILPQVADEKHLYIQNEYLHRSFLYTQFLSRRGAVGLYNVHLENMTSPRGRLVQIQALYNLIQEKNDTVVILSGDFNTFMTGPMEPALQFLIDRGFINFLDPEIKTGMPSWVPRLDHIFVRGAQGIEGQVFPRAGSDHKPVLAKIFL